LSVVNSVRMGVLMYCGESDSDNFYGE